MNDGYEYDLFLSFPRAGTALGWVSNHFRPVLEETLTDEVGERPRIFVFTEQETGVAWNANIVRSLQRSSYMLAVWAPAYFRSAWCLAEWESMRIRERLLGMRTVQNPHGLVFPVVYWDGKSFPEDAKAIFHRDTADLSKWALPMPQFSETRDYLLFYEAMRNVAKAIAELLRRAPAWQPDWPVVTPAEVSTKPPSVQPRM